MSMVRRLEYDIRESLPEGDGGFFDLALRRADHIFKSRNEFEAVMHAAREVGAHVFETRDTCHVPDGGHTFLLEGDGGRPVYYFMHCRDSYLVQLWILDCVRGARVGLMWFTVLFAFLWLNRPLIL